MILADDTAIYRLFFAVLFGSIVGIERELTHKTAGLRTHILVCLGSTVFTILSITPLIPGFQGDPGRIAAQIVTGIGFIGGGSVLRMGTSVQGLTTAASLWVIAAIGMLTGVGHLRIAAVATLLAFLVLFSIGNLEKTFLAKSRQPMYRLRLKVTLPDTQRDAVKQALTGLLDNPTFSESWRPSEAAVCLILTCFSYTMPNVDVLSTQLQQFPGLAVDLLQVKQRLPHDTGWNADPTESD